MPNPKSDAAPRRMTRQQAIEALDAGGERTCLIHAGDRGMWWRPNGSGYTDDRAQADAIDIIRTSGPEKRNRVEIV